MTTSTDRSYRPTESKFKGGAKEMYVTYDVSQTTRNGGHALYPKVKRVYIAGKVKDWKVGTFAKRTGRRVKGVKIDYQQSRSRYTRQGYTAHRGHAAYKTSAVHVGSGQSSFSKIVDLP